MVLGVYTSGGVSFPAKSTMNGLFFVLFDSLAKFLEFFMSLGLWPRDTKPSLVLKEPSGSCETAAAVNNAYGSLGG